MVVGLAAIKGGMQITHDARGMLHLLAVSYLAELLVGVPTIYVLMKRGWTSWPIYVAFGLLDAWLVVIVFMALMGVADTGQWSAFLPGLPEAFRWFFKDAEELKIATLFGVAAGGVFWVAARPDT